jgi:transcriptional regulator with XRE-family HTH domain
VSTIDIPAWAWQHAEARALLMKRDVAGLFKFVQKYSGASQTRIGTATGLQQGRVNEIINGRREVARFDVLERIADGLEMPDDARVLFGLAPRSPDREISWTFPKQSDAKAEIQRHAADARAIDVLAVRGLGLVALKDSLLRGSVSDRDAMCLRVLLLHPDSVAVAERAHEIGESTESLASGIRHAEGRLRELARVPGLDVQAYFYRHLPVWRVIRIDGTLYVSAFVARWEGHESTLYKLPPSPKGPLYNGFCRMLDSEYRSAERVV